MKSPRTWVALFGRSDSSTTGVGGFANSQCSGSGTSAFSLRLIALLALALTALLALTATPALAQGKPTLTTTGAAEVGVTSARLEGEVNPQGEAASPPTYFHFEVSADNGSGEPDGNWIFVNGNPDGEISGPEAEEANPLAVEGIAENLQPETKYFIRLAADNAEFQNHSETESPFPSFTTQATTPPALALSLGEVSYLKAHLIASVNPEGGNVNPIGPTALAIGWELQLSESGEPGTWAGFKAGVIEGPEAESNSPIDVSSDTPPLAPGTEYHARLTVHYAGIEESSGAEAFTTLAVAKPSIANLGVSAITPHTAAFTAEVNPNAPKAQAETDPAEQEAFLTHYHFQCEPGCPGLEGEVPAGKDPQAVPKEATGLIPGHLYSAVLIATNAGGTETTLPVHFTTEAQAPAIDATFAAPVSATTANLGAKVNPGGAATTVHFEYTTTDFSSCTPTGPDCFTTPESAPIGIDAEDHTAEAIITGLQPGTAYRYRALATNAKSPSGTPGPTKGFTTAAPSASSACLNEQLRLENNSTALPNCRAFEMLTPPYKDGYGVRAETIAEDGSRVIGSSLGNFSGNVAMPATRGSLGLEYELARGPEGWGVRPLTPSNPQFRSAQTYTQGTTADVTQTLFKMPTAPVGQDDYWLRGPGTSLTDIGPATPPADGPTKEPAPAGGPTAGSSRVAGGSADLSHLAFEVNGGLGWHGDPTPVSETRSLYEYIGTGNSEPIMVGVKGGAGSTELIGECGTELGGPKHGFNAMSADGETLFFTPVSPEDFHCGLPQPPVLEPYARIGESETVKLSAPSAADCHSPCGTGAPADALFSGASRDGSKAFFLSTDQLTDQASQDATPGESSRFNGGCPAAHESGCNLYEYDFDLPAGERLLTVSAGSSAPHVQGVIRSSQDGSHVYFVATGVLAANANEYGAEAQAGQDNLYVFEHDSQFPAGHTSFIGVLDPGDRAELWNPSADFRSAQVTPDGNYLVFQSLADLTPDDTSSGVTQVFSYEAQTGALRRISIGNEGFNDNGNTDEYPATIVEQQYAQTGTPAPRPLSVSNDGSYVFFSSANALSQGMTIPAPGAGIRSVYAYHDGEVHPIYGGNGTGGAVLLGASDSGEDVFFSTTDRLLPTDTDTQEDIYDARIGGGFPLAAGRVAFCSGDACHGAASPPPPAPALATPTFEAHEPPVTTCKKGFVKKRGKCVKRHAQKHHPKKSKRTAPHNRRAGN